MTDLTSWIGKERVEEDVLDLFPARGMAALLDWDTSAMVRGMRVIWNISAPSAAPAMS